MNLWSFLALTSIVSTMAWVINNWIRARHGYPMSEHPDMVGAASQITAITAENRDLKAQVGRLEDRLAVLERIATDPAERTAREIESLR